MLDVDRVFLAYIIFTFFKIENNVPRVRYEKSLRWTNQYTLQLIWALSIRYGENTTTEKG